MFKPDFKFKIKFLKNGQYIIKTKSRPNLTKEQENVIRISIDLFLKGQIWGF